MGTAMSTRGETQEILLERIRRGDFFVQVGTRGEIGRREVQIYARGLEGTSMVVGVPENVLVAWILLADPAAEGFDPLPEPERVRRLFEPQLSGLKALHAAAQAEQAAMKKDPEPKPEEPKAPAEDENDEGGDEGGPDATARGSRSRKKGW